MGLFFIGCFFQTYFLPVIGLVEPENLTPGDLVVRMKFNNLIKACLFPVKFMAWVVYMYRVGGHKFM